MNEYTQEMTHRYSKELDTFYNEHKDKCTICGKIFTNGMCAHLGYLSKQVPAVLCDDCAPKLKETVVRYHWKKDEYEKPAPTDKLWRYMDLAKLLSILSTEKLFFPSVDSFEDPFEGAKGYLERKKEWDDFYYRFCINALMTIPNATPEMLEPKYVEKEAQRLLSEINGLGKNERKHVFISCWHCNTYESEAMWKLYAKNTQNAVAIQTTVAHLKEALGRNSGITIGKVNYIDYNTKFAPINGSYWYKRLSFEYEHEVRAVYNDRKTAANGKAIPINVHTLIDSVYISPYAPKWFAEVVKSIMEKYGFFCPVVYSEMSKEPFY